VYEEAPGFCLAPRRVSHTGIESETGGEERLIPCLQSNTGFNLHGPTAAAAPGVTSAAISASSMPAASSARRGAEAAVQRASANCSCEVVRRKRRRQQVRYQRQKVRCLVSRG